jgi:hypothetical protein
MRLVRRTPTVTLKHYHVHLHAANERAGYLEDAQRDLKNIQLWSQELKAQLCDELKFSAGAPILFCSCRQTLVVIPYHLAVTESAWDPWGPLQEELIAAGAQDCAPYVIMCQGRCSLLFTGI